MANIEEFIGTLGTAARANKYRVSFSFPSAVSIETSLVDVDTLAKSASAPGKEIGIIEIATQGRIVRYPGDTTFDGTWSVDFYSTEDHKLRYDMLKWMDACDSYQKNRHSGDVRAIYSDLRVEQLDSAGEVTATYTLHGCWPSNVAEIQYADDTQDTALEFNVTFTYNDWVVGKSQFNDFKVSNPTKNKIA